MKTNRFFLFAAALTMLALTSCNKEYTVTVTANNPAWGVVTGGGTYADGTTITLLATPNNGYYFSSWLDGNLENPRSVVVSGNMTYTAVFTNDPNGGGGSSTDPQNISGEISANTTWRDLGLPVDYIVDGKLYIDGNALLTVEPGVTIMFTGVNGGIYVGENAGLRMVGTADKPIVFCGPANNPNNGSWESITLTSNRSDNKFEYVQFLRGGSGSDADWDGVLYLVGGARLSMKHCLIDGGLKNGLVMEDDAYMTAFENNKITHCAAFPVYSTNVVAACKNIGTNNTFSSNGDNRFFAELYYTGDNALTLHAIGIPYAVDGDMSPGNGILTIEAGVVVEMQANRTVSVYEGGVVMNGTADNPIIFRCWQADAHWNGINFNSNLNSNTMSHVQIQQCGASSDWSGNSCLYIYDGAHLTLTNCTFGPSRHYGVGIGNVESFGNITHSGCTFTGCDDGNVYIEGGGQYNGTEYEGGQVIDQLP